MAKVISAWPKRLTIAAALAIALFSVAVALFSAEILRELEGLRASPHDNVQWSLAQVEVEQLVLLGAIDDAQEGKASLSEVRRRFDILYSRAQILAKSEALRSLLDHPPSREAIERLRTRLDGMIPIIDAPDPALAARLGELDERIEALRPEVRRLVLDGVRLFAAASDEKRTAFARLIHETAAMTAVLILLLVLLVLLLLQQKKVSMERAEALQLSAKRFRETIEASINAIIIADAEGRIVHFNRAAETTFGYDRAVAVGARLADLIVPTRHRKASEGRTEREVATGITDVIGRGRVELEALRANGEEFPVEFSLSAIDGPNGPLFIAFARDITDRVEAERELMEARDKALAAAKAKSEFLAVMSHEMRTPLNGVMAILDLLRETRLDAEQRRYVETAIRSGEFLQRHVDDVLDVNRIEAGKLELSPEPTDLADLLDEVVRINEPAAKARRNVLETALEVPHRIVLVDRQRLGQMLLNLVGNAVKFTEGGRITITVRPGAGPEGLLDIAVTDTGIGIAPEDLQRIFEDFVTLDPSYSRSAGGYGLGLGICRRIAEAMGGEIAVSSKVGHGSRFTVRLALPPVPAGVLPDRRASAPHGASPAENGRAVRVLVVEDNETNRFAAREMLRRQGCEVSEAHDGLAGLARAEREAFDLILMDISMPRLDGLQAARRIRAGGGASREVPIVALTAHAMPEERRRVREAGMQDLLIKPLRQAHLECLIRRLRAGALTGEDDAPTCCDDIEAGRTDAEGVASGLDSDVLDFAVLRELAEVLGRDEFRRRLELFREELRALPADLSGIWRRRDLVAVRERAHAANGSAALFGAVRLNDVLGTLEEACGDGEAEFVAPLVDEVERAVEATEVFLIMAARSGHIPDFALPAPAAGTW